MNTAIFLCSQGCHRQVVAARKKEPLLALARCLPEVIRRPLRRLRNWYANRAAMQSPVSVPIGRLLLGDEGGIPAAKYAQMIGNPLRPSTPASESPHTKLLLSFLEHGDGLFDPNVFAGTPYYQNALQAIEILGHYFDATHEKQIVDVARRFVECHRNDNANASQSYSGLTPTGPPIQARPIAFSDCYQITDGHHRVASAIAKGLTSVRVVSVGPAVTTPLQSLLLDVLWTQGRRELYQPIVSPELGPDWRLVRRCTDRFDLISRFLGDHGFLSTGRQTYLDIGSSYGWFLSRMKDLGFHAAGIEPDPAAVLVGVLVYGLDQGQISVADAPRYLTKIDRQYDVVSCFSVMHHFATGRQHVAAEEFIRRIDRVTGRMLLFETGQNHEEWFKNTHPQWDAAYIQRWLRENTTFTHIIPLGVDSDAVPPFERNYGRTIFACLRD